MGISRVFQTPEIFGDLSVMENMLIPCFAKRDGGFSMHALGSVDNEQDVVEKAKDYIRAGDIFQVVPSQRWTQDFPLPPFALYRSLRRTNPSPFMFYFNFGDFQVIGASPEILVRVFDKQVTPG